MFLLCYKISDPISLYNVKNKWIRELKHHRPDVPVVLCGCQSDLRQDVATLHHLSKTGRTPVSSDQALAICCEIGAVNYVETSAKWPLDNSEAFDMCALAALKARSSQKHNNVKGPAPNQPPVFRPSNSTLSLFDSSSSISSSYACHNNNNNFYHQRQRSSQALRHSHRYAAQLVSPPPLNSPSSFSECDARLSTFSPEPLATSSGIPPSILENEAYQSDANMSVCSFQTFQGNKASVSSEANTDISNTAQNTATNTAKPQRPTSLFKAPLTNAYNPMHTLITPTGDPKKRLLQPQNNSHTSNSIFNTSVSRLDSLSEHGSHAAMIRPNCLTRRTSYRTYQKVPIPVPAPMSPVGSDYSFDLKSPTSSQCFSPIPRLDPVSEDMPMDPQHHTNQLHNQCRFDKTYESLKSTCSSQNSSKASSTSSTASGGSHNLSSYKLRQLMESSVETCSSIQDPINTEDPELLRNLNFVKTKSGVYRPLPEPSRRYKQSCSVM